jgi:hypothetical protein
VRPAAWVERDGYDLSRAFPADVVAAFGAKYSGWDVRLTYGSSGGRILFEVPLDRWLLAGSAQ